MNPTIVVSAYNRPHAIARLLSALSAASYPAGVSVRLVISVDRGPDALHEAVIAAAKDFRWMLGPKDIIEQPQHLGLVNHFLFCCGLTQQYEQVIYLEDDLLVSPSFYHFAAQALRFYADDDRLAAVSLYGLWFNGYTQDPFVPIADGSDVFFLQVPYTQGLAFTRAQWQRFSEWSSNRRGRQLPIDLLHSSFREFAADEWFPALAAFVVETGRFVVYPRVSLTSGMGDAGAHFAESSAFFQTPLQGLKESYQLPALDIALAVYDSFQEILPDRLNRLTHAFAAFDYVVDLYATKARHQLDKHYVLTSRPCRAAERTFGKTMWPMEANVVAGVPGNEIFFCRTAALRWGQWADLIAQKSTFDFFTRHRRASRKRLLAFALVELIQRLRHMLIDSWQL